MRLSTNMIYQQNMNSVSNAQSLWQDTGVQLSTGNRVNKPSDDPLAASQAIMVQQAQAQNDQYAIARTFANQNMSQEENILSNVTTAIQSAQSLIVNAGDGALSDDDRASLATKLQGIKDQIVNMANSTDGNGRFIFGGYKSDKPPYSVDATTGAVTYSGGDEAISQQVDASRTMTISHTGTQVFNTLTANATKEPDGSAGESDIFKTIDGAIAALKTPKANFANPTDYTAAIDKSNRGLSNSLNNVLSVRSQLGTQLDELDKLDSMGDDTKLINGDKLNALVGTDWTAAISQYSLQQVALQASYKTFTSMQGLSLFQMNS
ncbi:MAG: flagellar hook-associated protein FlgL [Ewingella americana]|uniref:FlgL family flagellar hook-associated protein n=2 Tax=Ewingella americana TaxID=41202 RepID=A0A085GFQ6_EWIA3|nr:flagellar hook-associated protein FlgL [Ewingella americana]KAA8729561.1 flagellar hook-filament junction protein FlgL [Ewingella americana]KFC82551.1 FlgL family flagellar hook-associated protein [Ewingella americana ATCC 33852]MCI1678711.1 flagellar hook-associated protein FlgL [Ewingella americana]MCI1854298.1 flagellar hook-associated protein FlgL [Ewingella americana]MCI1861598.1 flagellar hook-associated protein FlgL [Ewingella americana]